MLTPEQTDLDKLAKSLTKAQLSAISMSRGDDWWGYRFVNGSARGIPPALKRRCIDGVFLTDLGEALRNHLKGQNDG